MGEPLSVQPQDLAPSGPPAYAHIPMGLISSIDSRDYCPGPQRCLQASCWLVQLRLQAPLLPAPAGFASVAAVVGTQEFWQFMASVSQLIAQFVNPDPGNWGGVKGIG